MSSPDQLPPPPPPTDAASAVGRPSAAAQGADAETAAPVMPAARSNRMPQLAGANAQVYEPPKARRARRSRSRIYGIGAVIFIGITVVGYLGFRSYIYGDDAPPIPVIDDLSG